MRLQILRKSRSNVKSPIANFTKTKCDLHNLLFIFTFLKNINFNDMQNSMLFKSHNPIRFN